jgi:hypothetical protein
VAAIAELESLGHFAKPHSKAKMKPPIWSILILIALAILVARLFQGRGGHTIQYRGEKFNMSKAFRSYEDYKDDPNNLPTNEVARIERAITNALFPSVFESQVGLAQAVLRLKFPGYGCGGRGAYAQADGSTCSVFSVEIPMRDRERYFIGRTSGKQVTVVDDFVMSSNTNALKQVKIDGTRIRYYDEQGTLLREKQM